MLSRYAASAALVVVLASPVEAKTHHGDQRLSMQEAADFLRTICAEALPDFASAPAALKKGCFEYHPENEVYYSPRYDLSFMIDPGLDSGKCSMVFLSDEEFTKLAMIVSIVAAGTVKWPDGKAEIGVNDEGSVWHTKAGNGGEFLFLKGHAWSQEEPMYHAVMTASQSGS